MKNIQLSKRLQYIADFVSKGKILADIGTDHGFIPIYLASVGKIPKAFAMDINVGPLERAKEHIEEANLSNVIETRLSDGLDKLKPNEAESILIAGMGGGLIVKILTEGKASLEGVSELILSPHTEVSSVREYLGSTDFVIVKEGMVIDAGKYYVVIKAKRCKDNEYKAKMYEDNEYHLSNKCIDYDLYKELCTKYGKLLLEEKNGILLEFLKKEENKYKNILDNLEKNMSADGIQRREDIKVILQHVQATIGILQ